MLSLSYIVSKRQKLFCHTHTTCIYISTKNRDKETSCARSKKGGATAYSNLCSGGGYLILSVGRIYAVFALSTINNDFFPHPAPPLILLTDRAKMALLSRCTSVCKACVCVCLYYIYVIRTETVFALARLMGSIWTFGALNSDFLSLMIVIV